MAILDPARILTLSRVKDRWPSWIVSPLAQWWPWMSMPEMRRKQVACVAGCRYRLYCTMLPCCLTVYTAFQACKAKDAGCWYCDLIKCCDYIAATSVCSIIYISMYCNSIWAGDKPGPETCGLARWFRLAIAAAILLAGNSLRTVRPKSP